MKTCNEQSSQEGCQSAVCVVGAGSQGSSSSTSQLPREAAAPSPSVVSSCPPGPPAGLERPWVLVGDSFVSNFSPAVSDSSKSCPPSEPSFLVCKLEMSLTPQTC